MNQIAPTAAMIVIGNEILSGRTKDLNINYIAKGLARIGVRFQEARVVADDEKCIVNAVNVLRSEYDYIFTTGGIGPTHDDITTEAVAKAFGVDVVINPDALSILQDYYHHKELNEGRLKMAKFPEGANLIDNPVSAAPGFFLENVFVLAGIPNIMQAMFDGAKHHLRQGNVILSQELTVYTQESTISLLLSDLQSEYQTVEIGSYPFVSEGTFGVSVVLRSSDRAVIEHVQSELEKRLDLLEIKSQP